MTILAALSLPRPDFVADPLPGGDTVPTDGDDTLTGTTGNDLLTGLAGNDEIYGGQGADVLSGGDGNDLMFGGDGNDTFLPGTGNDTGYGGAGDDQFNYPFSPTRSTLEWYGGEGNDIFILTDLLDGVVAGDSGTDKLYLHWARSTLDPVVLTPDGASFDGMALAISGIDVFEIRTGSGSDSITTGDGDDALYLEWGANVADAGGGNDRVSYSLGMENRLEGGDGNDVLSVTTMPFGWGLYFEVTESGVNDGFGSDISGFEHYVVTGRRYDDHAVLGTGNDRFLGAYGNDDGAGGAGNDALYGGAGDDTLSGGDGEDFVSGNAGQDVLYGGAGDDRLLTGEDANWLFGGAGSDIFRFETGGAQSRIEDWEAGIDRLRIDRDLIGGGLADGRLRLVNLSYDTASGLSAQFVYRIDGSDGVLLWDANGSETGGESVIAYVTDAPTLSAGMILLFS